MIDLVGKWSVKAVPRRHCLVTKNIERKPLVLEEIVDTILQKVVAGDPELSGLANPSVVYKFIKADEKEGIIKWEVRFSMPADAKRFYEKAKRYLNPVLYPVGPEELTEMSYKVWDYSLVILFIKVTPDAPLNCIMEGFKNLLNGMYIPEELDKGELLKRISQGEDLLEVDKIYEYGKGQGILAEKMEPVTES